MQQAYNIIFVIAMVIAVCFTLLIFWTGKGDANSSGGSGVRTTFRGKASFDDKIFVVNMSMGAGFMVLMVILDFLAHRLKG